MTALLHTLNAWTAAGALLLLGAFLIGIAAVGTFRTMRRMGGFFMVMLAGAFLHSMATKPSKGDVTIALVTETSSNLTFRCSCATNLVGEASMFKMSENNGETWTHAESYFFAPSTNFTHTLNGNFIHSGIKRLFKLTIEKEASNAVSP